MNEKGIFMSFMVFLLVASVLALHDVTKRTDFWQEREHINELAFNNVNNVFNNLYEETVSLNKEGFAKIVQQRPMPFQYDFNENSIILTQRIPVRKPTLDAYIDALNVYSIFVNQEATTDLNVNTSTIKNPTWDPSLQQRPDLNYAILPQCLRYDVNGGGTDRNYMILRELADGEDGCVGGFDYTDLNIVDINIFINSSAYEAQSPPFTGTLDNQDPFVPGSELPYYRITIFELRPGCPGTGCIITPAGKYEMYGHFNPLDYAAPESLDWLRIYCNDAGDIVRIKLGKESENDIFPIAIYNTLSTSPINVDLNLTFDQKVELFYFTGFSISIEKKNFPIKRST
jgi:hypothetical protein